MIRGMKELQKLAVVYLTIMYVKLYTIEWLEDLQNDKLERIWKGAFVVRLIDVLSWNFKKVLE
jgi:hypothetical protein